MNLLHKLSLRSKVLLGTALALVAVAVPTFTQASLGDDRETKAYVQGMKGFDHVQFNSFTGVPNKGDERNFMTGKINNGPVGLTDPMNNVQSGDELFVRVYVHNNADDSLNASGKGVAKNTKVRVSLPTGLAQSQVASSYITADNATPSVIEDTLTVTAANQIGLQYVPGSAEITTNAMKTALSDEIVDDGVLIGDDKLDGELPGCFKYVALVTFRVKVTSPSYNLVKTVRPTVAAGETANKFTDTATVKAGDKVDFQLEFRNEGTTSLREIVIGDRLPVGLTYVPGTTQWLSGGTGGQWTKVTNDEWMKGGLMIGSYKAQSNAFVRFTAQVADESALECGVNQLVNHAFAKPQDMGNIQDSATVKVTKTCDTKPVEKTPVYTCEQLEIVKGDNRTVTVKDFIHTAEHGATFKYVVIDWGDGSDTLTNTAKGKDHTYAKDGTYVVKATAYFTVPGSTTPVAAPHVEACAKSVTFSTPVTPAAVTTPVAPAELPAAGIGGLAGLFAAVSAIGTVAHRLFQSRRKVR